MTVTLTAFEAAVIVGAFLFLLVFAGACWVAGGRPADTDDVGPLVRRGTRPAGPLPHRGARGHVRPCAPADASGSPVVDPAPARATPGRPPSPPYDWQADDTNEAHRARWSIGGARGDLSGGAT